MSRPELPSGLGVALLLVACGAAGPTAATGATLKIIDAAAQVRFVDAEPIPAAGGEALAVGDIVSTDENGFAQIDYPDGSVTRLDVLTMVEVVALGEAEQVEVDLRLDVGRVWNRVEELPDGASFQISTAVGTAAVRGTVFVVTCEVDGSCEVEVIEGQVEVDTIADQNALLAAGQVASIDDEGNLADPTDAVDPATIVANDPWYGRNQTRDGSDQFESEVEASGAWDTTYGLMTFAEGTDPLTATYKGEDGNLEGTLDGLVFTGTWVEPASAQDCGVALRGETHWGRFRFIFAPDLQSFEGQWNYCDAEPARAWRGNRLS